MERKNENTQPVTRTQTHEKKKDTDTIALYTDRTFCLWSTVCSWCCFIFVLFPLIFFVSSDLLLFLLFLLLSLILLSLFFFFFFFFFFYYYYYYYYHCFFFLFLFPMFVLCKYSFAKLISAAQEFNIFVRT